LLLRFLFLRTELKEARVACGPSHAEAEGCSAATVEASGSRAVASLTRREKAIRPMALPMACDHTALDICEIDGDGA
jgi:hypothetical protein